MPGRPPNELTRNWRWTARPGAEAASGSTRTSSRSADGPATTCGWSEPDISREHAEVVRDGDRYLLRDRESRFGTFVNNVRVVKEQALKHGDLIRLGQTGGKEMVFLCEPVQELRARPMDTSTGQMSAAGSELRQVAALLEGLRALGSSRVLDDVLALVIDSAIELSAAERGFIMMADAGRAARVQAGARRAGKITLPGQSFETSRKIPEEVFQTGEARVVADLLDGDLPAVHVGHDRARHPPRVLHAAAPRAVPRQGRRRRPSRSASACCTSTAASGARSRRPACATGLETLATEAAVALENARLYREAVEKAKMEQELRIAAEIQQSLLPPPAWSSDYFDAVGRTVPCRAIGGDFFEYFTMADGAAGLRGGRRVGQGRAGGAADRRDPGRAGDADVVRRRPGGGAGPRQRDPHPPRDRLAVRDGVLRGALARTAR